MRESDDDDRGAGRDLQPAARGSVAVMRDGERLDLEVTFGGQANDPVPRSRHVDAVLEPDPGAAPEARAILRSLLTGGRR